MNMKCGEPWSRSTELKSYWNKVAVYHKKVNYTCVISCGVLIDGFISHLVPCDCDSLELVNISFSRWLF